MPYIGNPPAESFTSFATQEFSTSATTSYTLNHAVTNENEIALFVNNVRQQPGSGKAYTASGTTLTLSAATASTDTMYCVFLGRALQTVNPAGGSIGSSQLSADAITGQTALAATPADTDEFLISGKDALASEPADTDEFLVSDAGTLKRIDYSLIKSSGKLLQSSLVTTSTNQAISSTSYADLTGMTLDITPVSSTSKFLITSFMNIGMTVSSGDEGFFSQILRDSTVVNNSDTGVGYGSIYYYTADASNIHMFYVNVCEDDHNTSSQVTIKVQGKTASGQSIQFNLNSSKKSYLLVQEIET